jgi:hypothetical protein
VLDVASPPPVDAPDPAPDVAVAPPADAPIVALDVATTAQDASLDAPPDAVVLADAAVDAVVSVDAFAPLDTAALLDAGNVNAALATGLVGYWKLDEAPGSGMALDSSGNGNHGVLEALDPAHAWTAGKVGGALLFPDGDVGSGVRVAASSSVNSITRDFTIAAWAYHTVAKATWYTILSRQIAANVGEMYNLSLYAQRLDAWLSVGGVPQFASGSPDTPLARWVHVAATYDGAAVRVYVDGTLAGMSPASGALDPATGPLYLGANKSVPNATANTLPMAGALDEVGLWSRALGPSELRMLASGVTPR